MNYTYEGEIVLDPFMRSGTTAIAAIMTHRFYVSYEIDETYVELSEKQMKKFSASFQPDLFEKLKINFR
ncbi:MAG: DNA methyltransferase [Candidatus Kryptonium sp.]|nr:DNA methyltransferase [Candidatus Kryptonium sp.]